MNLILARWCFKLLININKKCDRGLFFLVFVTVHFLVNIFFVKTFYLVNVIARFMAIFYPPNLVVAVR